MNSFKNLYNTTLLDLQSLIIDQYEDKDELKNFCKELLKRTVFWGFYTVNQRKNTSPRRKIQFFDQFDLLAEIYELMHFIFGSL